MTTTDFNTNYKAFDHVTYFDAKTLCLTKSDKPLTGNQLNILNKDILEVVDYWNRGALHEMPLRLKALLKLETTRPSYDVLVLVYRKQLSTLSYIRHEITIYSK